ncbi:MAG TPA: helix-turn-helix transcriptional regulator [Streptosporangiaceae bacterium]|nr:helix-turn-helix transcriptional regulator [Streptosporangiaceae bacterium]
MGGRQASACTYVHELEEHLRQALFEGTPATSSQAAVLLVRGALASGDRSRAACLAQATQTLAESKPDECDLTAAAAHARGLIEVDAAMLESAACTYSSPLARANATEDAGQALSERGELGAAIASLRKAYEQYEHQRCAEGMARVRARLRAAGVRLRHWRMAGRPAFGWASLTDTELQIARLVAQGLSNREVAAEVYLSRHTVAFHLRHIFGKLNIGSRVQLARLAAERRAPGCPPPV